MIDHRAPTPHRLRLGIVLVALLAALLAGCGGGGSTPGASEPGAAGSGTETSADDSGSDGGDPGGDAGTSACGGEVYAATVCAEVSLTGATEASGTAASPVGGAVSADGPATCSSWAEGTDEELVLPLFIDGLDDGTAFGMQSLVTDYSGPGTYPIDQLSGEGSDFTIVIGEERYQPDPEGTSTAELTVDADGSGSLTASGFRVDDGSGTLSEPIDAEITWTCADA
jgi:hypothetical protein